MNKSSLEYGLYEFDKYGYMQAPKPKLNGGLYTGEPFKGNYGNIPVSSDIGELVNENLRSSNGPVEGLFHIPGNIRPGNNEQKLPGYAKYSDKNNFKCLSSKAIYEIIQERNNNKKVLPFGGTEFCTKF